MCFERTIVNCKELSILGVIGISADVVFLMSLVSDTWKSHFIETSYAI